MKYIFAFFTIILASAVLAEKRPFERYQTIIDRRPFGQPPPGYNPEQFASEAARNPGKTEAELTKEQQQLQKAVALFAINIDPDGSTMVGFSDMSDPKSPAYYYMPVGETRNGWFVKEASPSSTNAFMTVVKDGVEVTLKLGESSVAAADPKSGGGRVGRLANMPPRPGAGGRSPLLRRAGGSDSPAPIVGRRARREQEEAAEAAAKREEEARLQEQKRKEEEAAAQAEADKAVREQEREEQRQQLMKIQEELRRAREEKALQRQKEAAADEEDND